LSFLTTCFFFSNTVTVPPTFSTNSLAFEETAETSILILLLISPLAKSLTLEVIFLIRPNSNKYS